MSTTRAVRWGALVAMIALSGVGEAQPPVDAKATLDQHLGGQGKRKAAATEIARVQKGAREVRLGKTSATSSMRAATAGRDSAAAPPPSRPAVSKRKG
jgi:hypothetical protein